MSEKNNVKEEKRFTININADGKIFTLSGPEGSKFSEIESVSYKLLTEMVILKWKEEMRVKAEEENAKKETEENEPEIEKDNI